jgi:hypothetical protein
MPKTAGIPKSRPLSAGLNALVVLIDPPMIWSIILKPLALSYLAPGDSRNPSLLSKLPSISIRQSLERPTKRMPKSSKLILKS